MEKSTHELFVSDTKMTIGVNFKVKIIIVNKQTVKLEIWDLGGEQRFKSLVPMYIRGALGGLFLYDISDYSTLAHIDDWLNLVKNEIRNKDLFPIICVGLKSSSADNREVETEEGIKIAKAHGCAGFVECDVETGQNIEEAFEALTSILLDIFHH